MLIPLTITQPPLNRAPSVFPRRCHMREASAQRLYLERLANRLDHYPDQSVLAALFVIYRGNFTPIYRDRIETVTFGLPPLLLLPDPVLRNDRLKLCFALESRRYRNSLQGPAIEFRPFARRFGIVPTHCHRPHLQRATSSR